MRLEVCHSLIAISFVGFFLSLWIRDRERARICRGADGVMRGSVASAAWLSVSGNLLQSIQSKRIALLHENLNLLSTDLRKRYGRYQMIRLIPVFFLAALVIIGITSRWLCA
jgi:hypothetical protein